MINYVLKGHSYGHEVQTIVQVFYPNLHYYKVEEISKEGITVVSNVELEVSSAFVYIDGILKAKKSVPYKESPIERENKRQIKLPIYLALKELTGYNPKWGMVTGIRPAKTVNELLDCGESEENALNYLTQKYFATKEKALLTLEVAKAEREILSKNTQYDYSLYIGIPFCPTRCLYCSFTSYPLDKYKKMVDVYLDNLIKEMEFVSANLKDKKLMTIYIGGGTPTSLNEAQLKRLLLAVENNFNTNNLLEYTVEAGRVDTITEEKLKTMKAFNVDRISINPQTMNNETLSLIGRNHNVVEVKEVFKMARDLGFKNINMDLILGLPEENEHHVINTWEEISKLQPHSVTVHTLAVKRASRLKEEFENYTLTEAQLMEKFIEISAEYAEKMDMKPYYMYRQKNMIGNFENVGYTKEGCESVYNVEIMEERQTIIALGAGGTTKIYYEKNNQLERIFNVKGVEEYISRIDEMIERKRISLFSQETQW
ncbi:MAG: coproporphyrinogen dehydrogenase HemZ [Anaerotignaceae bacterium]